MNWWLIVRGYQNGQSQQFMIYGDELTATRIALLVDPRVPAPKKDYTLFIWTNGAWHQQAYNALY